MNNNDSKFWMPRGIFHGEAAKGLSGTALIVLNQFYMKARWEVRKTRDSRENNFVLANQNEITFTYIQAKKMKCLGVSKKTFSKAIDDLIERGFIAIFHQGGGCQGDSSKYGLSDMWKRYKKDDFEIIKRERNCRKVGFMRDK